MGRIRSTAQFILMINRHRENINHPMRCKHFKLIPRHFWMPMASLKTIEQPNEIEGTNRPNKLKDAIQRKRRHQNLVWPCVLFACTYMVRCKCPDGKPVPVCVYASHVAWRAKVNFLRFLVDCSAAERSFSATNRSDYFSRFNCLQVFSIDTVGCSTGRTFPCRITRRIFQQSEHWHHRSGGHDVTVSSLRKSSAAVGFCQADSTWSTADTSRNLI